MPDIKMCPTSGASMDALVAPSRTSVVVKDDRFYAFQNSSIPLRALTIIEVNRFLVAYTRLYKSLCRSVSWSVSLSVGRLVGPAFAFFAGFKHF